MRSKVGRREFFTAVWSAAAGVVLPPSPIAVGDALEPNRADFRHANVDGSPFMFSDITAAVAKMQEMNVSPHPDGNYHVMLPAWVSRDDAALHLPGVIID